MFLFLSALIVAGCTNSTEAPPPAKPNFVIVYCDDLGYGDVGCFGSTKHRTPNIDRMAEEGARFTSFYVTSGVCTPSRSSLVTASYPRRVNMHEDGRNGWVLFPVAFKGLNPDEVTIAEVLKEQGYATGMVGKWHLGDQPQFLPTRQGFDSYYGIPYSNDMGVNQRNRKNPPLPLLRMEEVIEAPVDQNTITQRYTTEAVRFIEENKDGPFFLYMPHTMPHNPVHSSERFRGKSANGGYGDAVEEIDWSVGEILKTISRLGIDEDTFVMFTSDNGAASRWGGSNLPLSGWKGSTMEGGQRVPCVMRWPGKIPAGLECKEVASTLDMLPTLAKLAGGAAPADRIIDGHDIWPLMSGERGAKSPREAFFYYYRDQLQAVRSGQWKLCLALPKDGERRSGDQAGDPHTVRLFDLEADIGETTNVAADHPDVVERLTAYAEQARDDIGDRDRAGKNQRPAGREDNPQPLVMK